MYASWNCAGTGSESASCRDGDMTDALISIEYPHWLIIAGAILSMLGLVGLALRPRSFEADPSDIANDQEPSA
jgi:hypothetical protein